MNGKITCEISGNIAILTIENAEARNALSAEMLVSLYDHLSRLSDDKDSRAIILTGRGDHFCAGGDVSAMVAERRAMDSRMRIERAHRVLRLLVGGPKPVIAAVKGVAYGAGLSLALASDYVVASEDARFCAVFGKVGLVPDMGALWTLPQRIGLAEAKKLFVSCRQVDAQEAFAKGMIDELVKPDDVLSAAMVTARTYAEASPLAVALTKAAYAKGCLSLEDALQTEVDLQPFLYLSEDHMEGIAAFRERRNPGFKGV